MSYGTSGSPAAGKVAAPAIALIVLAVLNLPVAAYLIFSGLMAGQINVAPPPEMANDPDMANAFEIGTKIGGGMWIVVGAASIVASAVIAFGAIRMKGLQSYGLAMTASILALIPCTSPCCLAGIPIGIWSLIVLMNADVKAAFR